MIHTCMHACMHTRIHTYRRWSSTTPCLCCARQAGCSTSTRPWTRLSSPRTRLRFKTSPSRSHASIWWAPRRLRSWLPRRYSKVVYYIPKYSKVVYYIPKYVGEYQDVELTVYPNPANEAATISWKGVEVAKISIQDMNGQIVFEQAAKTNQINVNVADLSAGVYVVVLETSANQHITKRLMVN